MTHQDMQDLLIIHDTADVIEKSISSVFGEIGDDNLFRNLQFTVERMITRNSVIYDPEKDFDKQEIGEILEQRGDYEERAGRLLGNVVK